MSPYGGGLVIQVLRARRARGARKKAKHNRTEHLFGAQCAPLHFLVRFARTICCTGRHRNSIVEKSKSTIWAPTKEGVSKILKIEDF